VLSYFGGAAAFSLFPKVVVLPRQRSRYSLYFSAQLLPKLAPPVAFILPRLKKTRFCFLPPFFFIEPPSPRFLLFFRTGFSASLPGLSLSYRPAEAPSFCVSQRERRLFGLSS